MKSNTDAKLTKDPVFTVIIPTFQRQEMLTEAVESVLSQEFTDFELIVVDDASAVPVEVPIDDRLVLIRQPGNAGKSAALNRALSVAKGQYVAFLDDDDTWSPLRLSRALRAHRDVDADVAISGMRPPRLFRRGRENLQHWRLTQSEVTSREMLGPMGCITVRRSICPRFNESYRASQDLEWSIRLQQRAPRYAGVAPLDWNWRRHYGVRNLNGPRARIDSAHRILKDHYGWYREYPRARAYRLYRLGVMHLEQGGRRHALNCLVRSLASKPLRAQGRLAVNIVLSLIFSKNISFRQGTSRSVR